MELEKKIDAYQTAFNNQDLLKLEELFADNITLKDWEINVNGKQKVLEANKKIFNSIKSINSKTVNNYFFDNIAICVLKITINQNEIIDVVDIVEFDDEGKILNITAYKG